MPVFEEFPNLNTKLADFVPLRDERYQKELTFDWENIRRDLSHSRKDLAMHRFNTAAQKLQKEGRE